MITLNGTTLTSMGVTLLQGAYAELLQPAAVKTYIENDDPTKNGIQIDTLMTPKQDKRDLTLRFLVQGSSESDFLAKYNAFIAELQTGYVELYIPDLLSKYRLLYRSCTKYANYRLHACEVAIKFTEPDPSNRAV